MEKKQFDFLVVGSGFAGSITAMILNQKGFRVCVIEREVHPRFAVGESSTPIADMILRDFSKEYDLPFLKNLSRYGSWQKHYPDVVCGLKRGFSYYMHHAGMKFSSDQHHSNELLVAASENDENSDTNWLRSDVDYFLVKEARKLGIEVEENASLEKLSRENLIWNAEIKIGTQIESFTCGWVIDATGSAAFSEKFFETSSDYSLFETNSAAIFSHYEHTDRWMDYLKENGFYTSDYPYNPDDSALHQIIEEGWLWMLRFNNDLLSAGIVFDLNDTAFQNETSGQIWDQILGKYPSINGLIKDAVIAQTPGRLIRTGRLQRKINQTYGDGWLTLHHSSGFIDPLHSTGIAFTLSGIEKIVRVFTPSQTSMQALEALGAIQVNFEKELKLIDLLVASCYKSRWHFPLFAAAVMLYFIASVHYEQSRLKGKIPDTFLCAGEQEIASLTEEIYAEIKKLNTSKDKKQAEILIHHIKDRIAPFNHVGLMDREAKNMYRHTAVEIH